MARKEPVVERWSVAGSLTVKSDCSCGRSGGGVGVVGQAHAACDPSICALTSGGAARSAPIA